jgi:undecaprenyl-diphosphatase
MDVFQAIIIAIVEGLTEFLPISSTGHMVIVSSIMGIAENDFVKLFEVVIQLAAILAVVIMYWKKFFDFKNLRFYLLLIVATIPALIVGALLKSHVDKMLESPLIIALILLLGGIVLLFIDDFFKKNHVSHESEMSNKNGLIIGVFQTLSVILPGLSRSAATIIGGMQQGLTRKFAAEFSFFLAVPTMFAATIKSLYDVYKESPEILNTENLDLLMIGNVVAFVVAYLSIKFFIGYLSKNGFKMFGYYRILLGATILILHFSGFKLFTH